MNRATFISKVSAFAGEEKARLVEVAYLLSKKVHKGQTRKETDADGNPLRYFEHPRRVALILMDEAGITDPDLIIAALLHDAIEDTDEVILVSALIERLFGWRAANIIRTVTKAPKAGYLDRLRNKDHGGRPAIVVKAADRLDNLRTLPADNPAFCRKQIQETQEVFLPLFFIAANDMSREYVAGFRKMVEEIQNITRAEARK